MILDSARDSLIPGISVRDFALVGPLGHEEMVCPDLLIAQHYLSFVIIIIVTH